MGKYILLVTLGTILGTMLLSYQSQRTSLSTGEERAERQRTILARQSARSAFGMATSQIKRDLNGYRVNRTDVPYDRGTFDLSVVDTTGGAVAITAVGRYDGAAYRIQATVVEDIDGFPGLGVQGALGSARAKGNKFLISGRDTDPVEPNTAPDHGSGLGADRHGMRLSDEDAADLVADEYPDDQVVGVGGQGDIVHETISVDVDALRQNIVNHATHDGDDLSGDVGSRDAPAIVAVNGDVSLGGNVHGIGALFVDGNFRMRGNAQWEGLVIVANGDASVDTEGDVSGNARVFGSFIMQERGGAGALNVGGSVRIQYSSKALKVLDDILPGVEEAVELRVVERREGPIRSTG